MKITVTHMLYLVATVGLALLVSIGVHHSISNDHSTAAAHSSLASPLKVVALQAEPQWLGMTTNSKLFSTLATQTPTRDAPRLEASRVLTQPAAHKARECGQGFRSLAAAAKTSNKIAFQELSFKPATPLTG